ncbi:MAG: carboxypeptidase-like regulatory domain-containing protein [Conexibacter sp.]
MASTLHRACARLRSDQTGIGLIEVVVSALLVVLVSSGVYVGLDASSRTSGINKQRSLASGIAQQDQDRMRAMAVNELSNYRATTTTTIGAVTYSVASAASWVTDATGTASCTSANAKANYLRISSAVTWPNMRIAPVAIESVVAPPAGSFGTNQGSLAVQVRDRNGAGVAGVAVSLTGARNYTDTTNALGCVLWGYLPVGNYTVALAKGGYVDPQGVATPSRQAGVVGEATSTVAFDYDAGGRIEARYETWDGSAAVPANGSVFTAVNSHLTVPLAPFGDGAPHATYTSGLVFPFGDPYGVYAGSCAGADPQLYGQPIALAQVQPGVTASIAVREPPVNLRVMRGATPVQGAVVTLTGTGAGCAALPVRTTGADGYLTDRAFPYGPYDVCVQETVAGTPYKRTGSVANTAANGVSATFDMASAPAGTCP